MLSTPGTATDLKVCGHDSSLTGSEVAWFCHRLISSEVDVVEAIACAPGTDCSVGGCSQMTTHSVCSSPLLSGLVGDVTIFPLRCLLGMTCAVSIFKWSVVLERFFRRKMMECKTWSQRDTSHTLFHSIVSLLLGSGRNRCFHLGGKLN